LRPKECVWVPQIAPSLRGSWQLAIIRDPADHQFEAA
jgi:hypothetical protein